MKILHIARGRPASNRGRGRRTRAQPPATPHAGTDRLGAERERAGQQLARVEEARWQTEQRSASELGAAAERLADLQDRHSVSVARETRICLALQQRLLELESAVRKADERRASEAVSFADQLAKRHAEFTTSLAQAAQSRDALAAELSAATAALGEARQARKADAAAAAEHLGRREAELRAGLADAVAVQTALDNALEEAEAAHQATRQRAAIDLAAANERQAALEVGAHLASLQARYDTAGQRHGPRTAAVRRRNRPAGHRTKKCGSFSWSMRRCSAGSARPTISCSICTALSTRSDRPTNSPA